MKQRCTNPKDSSWKYYGGRGITICDRWLHSFEAFYADMGPRPRSHFQVKRSRWSLDRIDADGHYSPENCRWANYQTQENNRRGFNQRIEFKGLCLTCAEWERRLGINQGVLWWRLKHWPIERALTKQTIFVKRRR